MNKRVFLGPGVPLLCSAPPLPAQSWHRASYNWAEAWVAPTLHAAPQSSPIRVGGAASAPGSLATRSWLVALPTPL